MLGRTVVILQAFYAFLHRWIAMHVGAVTTPVFEAIDASVCPRIATPHLDNRIAFLAIRVPLAIDADVAHVIASAVLTVLIDHAGLTASQNLVANSLPTVFVIQALATPMIDEVTARL
jgi:hypothetical protein